MKKFSLALAVFAIFSLAACGAPSQPGSGATAGEPESGSTSASSESKSDEASLLKEYFDAYASSDPEAMRSASENVAEGSVAQKYITHQANIVEANDASGYERYVQEADFNDDSVAVCYEGDDCGEFADLTFDEGNLSSFTIDGNYIENRVIIGDGSVVESQDVAGFEVVSAYQAIEGTLMAVVRFHAYDRPMDYGYVATYRQPSGQQVDDVESDIPSRVAEDSNQLGIVNFPRSKNGGDMFLKYSTEDERELIVETVKVPLVQG